MSKLKKGDRITIFCDPVTKTAPEGEAELLKKLLNAEVEGGPESWEVKFLTDGFVCQRLVG